MPVVRKASGEGRAIVEGKPRMMLRKLELLIKGINFIPIVKDFQFLSWEVWSLRNRMK